MYSFKYIAIVALAALGVQACRPTEYQCGNRGGAPGPDGAIYVCDAAGQWQFQAQCGGAKCCRITGSNVNCIC
ncbi:hypothetical protein HC256_003859 [Beauveria bassiana]|uniref:Uncharacterized protein n=1 Tax=Beauveria bassiana (strain ARSEF 2860) TaxID=655819 RepID=J4UJB5_BEAB2|nr:uncharacterized protein BBA_07211 [Beauveria bassiana ARSEF 2860]EJP63887.1 hypothetical protein BBA_07211 [Beauveria bassiana ARSEF 2860]KAH8714989.1 hypothetical protein HC256_003859 [Beauveria bassiana]